MKLISKKKYYIHKIPNMQYQKRKKTTILPLPFLPHQILTIYASVQSQTLQEGLDLRASCAGAGTLARQMCHQRVPLQSKMRKHDFTPDD